MSKKQKLLPKNYFIAVFIFTIASLSSGLHAVPISIGNLTYDADVNTQIIVDTQNKRDWLRWDVLKSKTYQETLLETQTGSYIGWQIADYIDAQLFTNAFASSVVDTCPRLTNGTCFSQTNAPISFNSLLGDSFSVGGAYDFVFFKSNLPDNVGFIKSEIAGSKHNLIKHPYEFANTATTNNYADPITGIGWLLYRDHPVNTNTVSVNEPAFNFAFFFAVLSMLLYRRKSLLK